MATIEQTRATLADYIRRNPKMTFKELAAKLPGVSVSTLSQIARDHGIHRKPRLMATLDLSVLDECQCNRCQDDSLAGCRNNATVEKNGLHLCEGCAESKEVS